MGCVCLRCHCYRATVGCVCLRCYFLPCYHGLCMLALLFLTVLPWVVYACVAISYRATMGCVCLRCYFLPCYHGLCMLALLFLTVLPWVVYACVAICSVLYTCRCEHVWSQLHTLNHDADLSAETRYTCIHRQLWCRSNFQFGILGSEAPIEGAKHTPGLAILLEL